MPLTQQAANVIVAGNEMAFSEIKAYIKDILRPMTLYYKERFDCEDGILSDLIRAFKALRIFNPWKVKGLKPGENEVNELRVIPAMKALIPMLIKELPTYRRLCEDLKDPRSDVLQWFKANDKEIPNWFSEAKFAALIQPSSGAAERAFSILLSVQGDNQSQMLHDYLEASMMLRCNRRKNSISK
jgi:hypothetical protein